MSDLADPVVLARVVGDELADFARLRRRDLAPLGPAAEGLVDTALDYVAGGKRLRAAFCWWGWRAAGGAPDDRRAVRAAASFEWLQGSALVHDDVMDASDTRRGRPAAHRAYESEHRAADGHGAAAQYGEGAAILLGDLMLTWCDAMLRSCGLDATAVTRAGALLDRCTSEVIAGQYLDLVQQAYGEHDVDAALRVVRYKAATYTVERPLHVGAALAGGDDDLRARLSAYALPLGEAFQLRDDLLGVFGDPDVTGKPAGDDLREGKRTVLIARAHEAADAAGRALIGTDLGRGDLGADDVERLRDLLVATGARADVEQMITDREDAADTALAAAGLDPVVRDGLADLARRATRRTS